MTANWFEAKIKYVKVNKKAKIGETVDIELAPKNFGRIAAQTAKATIQGRFRSIFDNNFLSKSVIVPSVFMICTSL